MLYHEMIRELRDHLRASDCLSKEINLCRRKHRCDTLESTTQFRLNKSTDLGVADLVVSPGIIGEKQLTLLGALWTSCKPRFTYREGGKVSREVHTRIDRAISEFAARLAVLDIYYPVCESFGSLGTSELDESLLKEESLFMTKWMMYSNEYTGLLVPTSKPRPTPK